ncbi:MAG: LacI family DNA-binding transcriptional regulator [Puniceicoccaceae bacterium]
MSTMKGMSKDQPSPRRGRPPLDDSVKQAVLNLVQGEGRDRSLRWLAKEVGICPVSVRRILEEAGQWERRKRTSRKKRKSGTKKSEFVNLAQIAEHVGVSKSTVSLALNGSPKIRESTRERVQEAARAMGYRAHPFIGAHMASVRSRRVKFVQESIAYVYAYPDREFTWKSSYALPWGPSRKFDAASRAAFDKGYLLKPQNLFEFGKNARRLEQVLYNRGVRGLLLDFPAYYSAMANLKLDRFSCVSFRDQSPVRLHVVGHDMFRNILIAYARLWKLGYRRIGYMASDAVSTSSLFVRDAAFRHAQYHLTPPEDQVPILHSDTIFGHYQDAVYHKKRPQEINRYGEADWLLRQDWSELKAQIDRGEPMGEAIHSAILGRWLEDYEPDAVICEHGDMVKWLDQLGYSVPGDIGVIRCSLNSDVLDWSGIRRADELIAEYAIELLLHKIAHGELGRPSYPIVQRILGDWVEGSTTRNLAPSRPPLARYAREWIAKVLDTTSSS